MFTGWRKKIKHLASLRFTLYVNWCFIIIFTLANHSFILHYTLKLNYNKLNAYTALDVGTKAWKTHFLPWLKVWWSWLVNETKVTLEASQEAVDVREGRVMQGSYCGGCHRGCRCSERRGQLGQPSAGTTVLRDSSLKEVASHLTSLYSEKVTIHGKVFCEEDIWHKITSPNFLIVRITWTLVRYMADQRFP